MFESGKTGLFSQGGWGFFGNQPGTMTALTIQNNPSAKPSPWIPPGLQRALEKCKSRVLQGEHYFDGAPLVHGFVALRCLVEREAEVEHLAGVDLAVPDGPDEVR